MDENPPLLNFVMLRAMYEEDTVAMALLDLVEGKYGANASVHVLYQQVLRENTWLKQRLEGERVLLAEKDADLARVKGRATMLISSASFRIEALESQIQRERDLWNGVTQVVRDGRVIKGRIRRPKVKRSKPLSLKLE